MQQRYPPPTITPHHIYAVKRLTDGAVLETFATKREAKQHRDTTRANGTPSVVSRTRAHPNGESHPDPAVRHL